MEVNADHDSILLKYRHNISNPVWVLLLLNKSIFDEFMNFDFDCSHDVGSKPSLLLLNRLGIRYDVAMMHGHLRIETRHVFIAPGKCIYISHMRDMRSCFVGNRLSLIEMSFRCD